jgi:hypothetical protein
MVRKIKKKVKSTSPPCDDEILSLETDEDFPDQPSPKPRDPTPPPLWSEDPIHLNFDDIPVPQVAKRSGKRKRPTPALENDIIALETDEDWGD